MAEALVRFERAGHVALVTLDRPAKLNALTPAMLDELESIARRIDDDVELRVVILCSAGERAFCVGADILEWSSLGALDMWRRWTKRGHQVFDLWARLRQPVIAALSGSAFGGGLELALTADLRLAADHVQFALPEASISTCPGWSGSQRLVRLIGLGQAKYLALSGERLGAAGALANGLVHEVLPRALLMERCVALAHAMSHQAPVALQLTKQLLNAAGGEGGEAALEGMAGALAAHTKDALEGIASFREKRPANFQGA